MLSFFEAARGAGIDITFDQYPYTAGSTLLSVVLPPWAREGGVAPTLARLRDPAARDRMRRDIAEGIPGWENIAGPCGWDGIMVAGVASPAKRALEGESIAAIAQSRRADPFDVVADLLLEERMQVSMVDFYGCEENVRAFAATASRRRAPMASWPAGPTRASGGPSRGSWAASCARRGSSPWRRPCEK